MPTIGSTSKPAYVYDAGTDTWIPIGPGEHTHEYIGKDVITTTGDIIYASAANTPARRGIGSTGQVLTVSGGLPTWATPAASFVGCSIYNSGNFASNNNTSTIMTFDSENFDTDALHSTSSNTSRITIPSGKGGKWLFVMNIGWNHTLGTTNAGAREITLKKNGSAISAANKELVSGMGGGTTFVAFSQIVEAVATDYFEIEIYQNSGSNLTAVRGGAYYNNWSCQYLGA